LNICCSISILWPKAKSFMEWWDSQSGRGFGSCVDELIFLTTNNSECFINLKKYDN
jgi:hypothetical protein